MKPDLGGEDGEPETARMRLQRRDSVRNRLSVSSVPKLIELLGKTERLWHGLSLNDTKSLVEQHQASRVEQVSCLAPSCIGAGLEANG